MCIRVCVCANQAQCTRGSHTSIDPRRSQSHFGFQFCSLGGMWEAWRAIGAKGICGAIGDRWRWALPLWLSLTVWIWLRIILGTWWFQFQLSKIFPPMAHSMALKPWPRLLGTFIHETNFNFVKDFAEVSSWHPETACERAMANRRTCASRVCGRCTRMCAHSVSQHIVQT